MGTARLDILVITPFVLFVLRFITLVTALLDILAVAPFTRVIAHIIILVTALLDILAVAQFVILATVPFISLSLSLYLSLIIGIMYEISGSVH